MKRISLFGVVAVVLIVVAGGAFAQRQHHRGKGPGVPPGPQTAISGTVVSFGAGAGRGMPSLVISVSGSNITLALGPFWFLQDAKFTAAVGDLVEVTTLPCNECPSGYAVIAVSNITNGTTVTLRDGNGTPLWSGRADGPGARECPGGGLDMTQVTTFDGKVKAFTGGPGEGRPVLVLDTAAGERTFLLMPYRVIADAGLQLVPGDALTITAAPNGYGEWVAVTLVDPRTGATLVFRDPQSGFPAGGRGWCC